MTTTQLTFDKLVYIDRLKSAGVDEPHARAHAEALDQALRDTVATRQDIQDVRNEIIRLENKIESTVAIAVRDLKIWMGGAIIVAFGALATIKFFG
jgi:hypothetical protein